MSDDEVLLFGDDGGADDSYAADGAPDPEQVARRLHEHRRWLSANALPIWEDMDTEEREVAVLLMGLIIDWLRREGTVR